MAGILIEALARTWTSKTRWNALLVHCFAAFEHGGPEEGVTQLPRPGEPAGGTEHRGHGALIDPEWFPVLEMVGAGQIRHGGAEWLKGAAGRVEVGRLGERAGEGGQFTPRRRGIAGVPSRSADQTAEPAFFRCVLGAFVGWRVFGCVSRGLLVGPFDGGLEAVEKLFR